MHTLVKVKRTNIGLFNAAENLLVHTAFAYLASPSCFEDLRFESKAIKDVKSQVGAPESDRLSTVQPGFHLFRSLVVPGFFSLVREAGNR